MSIIFVFHEKLYITVHTHTNTNIFNLYVYVTSKVYKYTVQNSLQDNNEDDDNDDDAVKDLARLHFDLLLSLDTPSLIPGLRLWKT